MFLVIFAGSGALKPQTLRFHQPDPRWKIGETLALEDDDYPGKKLPVTIVGSGQDGSVVAYEVAVVH